MNIFPLPVVRTIIIALFISLAVMFFVSVKASFTQISLVEENPQRERPEPRGNMPPEGAPAMEAVPGAGMGFALSDKQSDTVSQLMAKLRTAPTDAALLMELGDVFMTAEDWGRALVFLQRAVISAPSDVRPRFMVAVCQFRLGDPKAAAETFEALLEIKKEPQAMYNLGIIYKYNLKQSPKATALFNQIIASSDADDDLIAKTKKEMGK